MKLLVLFFALACVCSTIIRRTDPYYDPYYLRFRREAVVPPTVQPEPSPQIDETLINAAEEPEGSPRSRYWSKEARRWIETGAGLCAVTGLCQG